MNIIKKLKRENELWSIMKQGYSRGMAIAWRKAVQRDNRYNTKRYGRSALDDIHQRGYLSKSIETYDLLNDRSDQYVTDFEYMFLSPYNNNFSKLVGDILTTSRVLKGQQAHCRKVYYSIFQRNGEQIILSKGEDYDRPCTVDDVIDLVIRLGRVELRPSFWASTATRYELSYERGLLFVNGQTAKDDRAYVQRRINRLQSNYVVSECVDADISFGPGLSGQHYIKFWLSNDAAVEPQILDCELNLKPEGGQWTDYSVDEDGVFTVEEETYTIPHWESVCAELVETARELDLLDYFTVSIALDGKGGFTFQHFSANPYRKKSRISLRHNAYLRGKAAANKKRMGKITLKMRQEDLKRRRHYSYLQKTGRKGIRPYMQQTWLDQVESDRENTKTTTMEQKKWCWERGFLSYRIEQYGLTEENYRNFLSDYDYHWLNRINNIYQLWVNDKTTFRLMLDPFADYIPKYYFVITKRRGAPHIGKMWDCDGDVQPNLEGILTMLERKGKLAMKPSSGTHGDGFYCLAYEDGHYTVNGEEATAEQIDQLIAEQKSFYVITEYVEMHPMLKAIYPKSVNTIRMMVINSHGYDPKIMQTYMRIGSSATGFTDNVGYGGICVMVDSDTGELHDPETITDHKFNPCPVHPDTGTPIAGVLPNWQLVREKVLDICRYLGELEYLGFDIAITEEGFQVIEINIHQDLHKVATHSDEIKEFFNQKIAIKKKRYRLK